MEHVACYSCGSTKNSFYASENGYSLIKCDTCGLLYVSQPPSNEEISQAHKLGQHRGDKLLNVTGSFSKSKVLAYKKILKSLYGEKFFTKKMTWLDIGCGHGELLLALKEISNGNITVKGVEPNEDKTKSAQKHGLDVSNFNLNKHTNRYNVISFLNVYSHLPNPPKMIDSWKNLLNPNGEFLLETGDTANLKSQDHYRPFDLPDHLSFASEEIVKNILENANFEILGINKYPFIEPTLLNVAKELIKIALPNKNSRIKSLLNYKIYSNTDMYIRAKIKST